jgi:DNA-directed RNA polymerase subunit K/omega
MICQAVKQGVKAERIAAALDIDVKKVLNELNLLHGIHPDAVELLKDKPIHAKALRVLRRVKPLRQFEMAENMCAVNNYTEKYALALVAGTRVEQMVYGRKPKELNGVNAESLARMEQEMESLRVDFEQLEQSHSDNVYALVVIQGYVKRLLTNERIKRFLERNHPDMLPELIQIAEMDSLVA